jgi:hypothetical protein
MLDGSRDATVSPMRMLFQCDCGHQIRDIDGSQSALVVPLQNHDAAESALASDLKQVLAGFREGSLPEAVRRVFPEPYPSDASLEEVMMDLVNVHLLSQSRRAIQCPSCSRLYIQTAHEGADYAGYVPARGKTSRIFSLRTRPTAAGDPPQ